MKPFKQELSLQNIRPEKLILTWRSAENNNHFPPLKLSGFGLAKKLPGVRNKTRRSGLIAIDLYSLLPREFNLLLPHKLSEGQLLP